MKYLFIIILNLSIYSSQWIEKSVTYTGKPGESSLNIEKESEFRVLREILSQKLRNFNLDGNLLWQAMQKKYLEQTPQFNRNITSQENFYQFKNYLSSLVSVNRSRSPLNAREMNLTMKGLVDSASLKQLYTKYILGSLSNQANYQYVFFENQISLLNTDWEKIGVEKNQIANMKGQVESYWKQWLANELKLPVSNFDSLNQPQGRAIKLNIDIVLRYKRFNQALSQHQFDLDSSITVQDLFSKDFIFFKNKKNKKQVLNALVDVKKNLAQMIYSEPLNEMSLLSSIVQKEAATDQKKQLTIQGYKSYQDFQSISEKIVNSHIMNSMKSRIMSYSNQRAKIEVSFTGQVNWEELKQLFAQSHSHVLIQ